MHGDKRICVCAVGVDDAWVVCVGVDGTWYSVAPNIFVDLCKAYPSEFQLALSNVWGKRSIVHMCSIYLLMVCGFSTLCIDRMPGFSTMHLCSLVPSLFYYLVG